MTKAESTHQRNTQFSTWIRNKLPDSFSGFRAYDIDYVMWRKTNWRISHIMLIEEKNGNSQVSADQALLLAFLSRAVKTQAEIEGVKYLGTHEVRLSDGNPSTSIIELDGRQITEEELRHFLSME